MSIPTPLRNPAGRSVRPSVYSHPTRGFYRSWLRIQLKVNQPYDSFIATDWTEEIVVPFPAEVRFVPLCADRVWGPPYYEEYFRIFPQSML